MLDTVNNSTRAMGELGAEFMAHRLLHTNLSVLARWDMVRHIAARLARNDEESDVTYSLYLRKLCVRATENGGPSLAASCREEHDNWSDRRCGGLFCNYDLVAAAAYVNKISIIDEVANDNHTLRVVLGIFGNPFDCAALGGNLEAAQLLFRKLAQVDGEGYANVVRSRRLSRVAQLGSTPMMRAFLAPWPPEHYDDIREGERNPAMANLDRALCTPDEESFGILMAIKKKTSRPEIDEDQWLRHVEYACRNGPAELVQRFLTLKAVHHFYEREDVIDMNLFHYVFSGSQNPDRERIVRMLLAYGVPVGSDAVAGAVKMGNLSLLKTLVDAGADLNSGDLKPLVCAISMEREYMFEALIGWGARLDRGVVEACMEVARKEGLDSMQRLIDAHLDR